MNTQTINYGDGIDNNRVKVVIPNTRDCAHYCAHATRLTRWCHTCQEEAN